MEVNQQTVKVGVIGAGVMGTNHARIFSEMENVVLAGIYDQEYSNALLVAKKNGCKAFHSLGELLNSDIDAVSIAVPTSSHKPVALAAIEKGKHVLLEKPIAGTIADAEEIINAARDAKVILMIGHVERFNPVVNKIKELIAEEDIISISFKRVGPLPPRIKDAGVIIDLGIHDIDLARYLTGEDIEEVYCVTSKNVAKYEDSSNILLRTITGKSIQITTNWVTPFKLRQVEVITKKKLLICNLITQQITEYSNYSSQDSSYIVRDIMVKYDEPLKREFNAFTDSIRNNEDAVVTGNDGLESLKIAVYATRQTTIHNKE